MCLTGYVNPSTKFPQAGARNPGINLWLWREFCWIFPHYLEDLGGQARKETLASDESALLLGLPSFTSLVESTDTTTEERFTARAAQRTISPGEIYLEPLLDIIEKVNAEANPAVEPFASLILDGLRTWVFMRHFLFCGVLARARLLRHVVPAEPYRRRLAAVAALAQMSATDRTYWRNLMRPADRSAADLWFASEVQDLITSRKTWLNSLKRRVMKFPGPHFWGSHALVNAKKVRPYYKTCHMGHKAVTRVEEPPSISAREKRMAEIFWTW